MTTRAISRLPIRLLARGAPDPAVVSRKVRRWFRANGRDLPWRRTRDPYHILVSELMLQQTQVSRVVGYYERFLERYPTLEALANARQRHVVEAWEGLGYYARARNLHALAGMVTRDGDGGLPADPALLRELPGVGAYTAGAVASFAFERPAALVDTNVGRVIARIFAPHLHPRRARDRARIWRIAESIVPRRGAYAWTHNQALMELGALICTARVRHCKRCPVRALCLTRARELRPGTAAARASSA
jgi:A/G-specific adenine glycosylase